MTKDDPFRKGATLPIYKSWLAGSISGVISRTVTAPIDLFKLRAQTSIHNEPLLDMVRHLIRNEGVLGLWKGNVPGSLLYFIYNGVEFASYSWYNKQLSNMSWNPEFHSLLVGGLTGITASLLSYPCDVLRTRFAINQGNKFWHLVPEIRSIYSHEGIQGFYRGCVPSTFTISITSSLLFGTYETIKIFCSANNGLPKDERSHVLSLLNTSASAISGFISKFAVFPLDTIRRRLQVRDSSKLSLLTTDVKTYQQYKNISFIKLGRTILRQEGFASFYRGVGLSLCKSVPGTTITLWTYENLLHIIS